MIHIYIYIYTGISISSLFLFRCVAVQIRIAIKYIVHNRLRFIYDSIEYILTNGLSLTYTFETDYEYM